jgi:SRSO17 transposase
VGAASANLRTEAGLEDLVYAADTRWTIDDATKGAKRETGLDEYEVRRWQGWHRHTTLSLLAYAFLVVTPTAMRPAGSGEEGGRVEVLTLP